MDFCAEGMKIYNFFMAVLRDGDCFFDGRILA